ncbi:hypothetical protein MMAD_17540 [Mycolicibacterium madagascariense]|uniref:DUF4333 domain-containing protein n=1 Tax=Mycolicibacterium madagascariense TaxID=212765 RepID=A0A7I7XCG9_9MYCO|nr:DUF4333 domain-containing protein [Mycolicibacterium madagascariense]BBZ27459.1 hypothetical protein MMAD_17540 [Mycolicibacterium madagascariense]
MSVPSSAQATPGERDPKRPGAFSLRRVVIGIGILLLVAESVALILGVNQLGAFGGDQLDVVKVQAGVQRILSDPVYGYGGHAVTSVSCNHGRNPSGNKGNSFTCAVTVDGTAQQVRVVVEDDTGTYAVDRPQ